MQSYCTIMDTKFNSKRAREEPQHGGPWTHGSQRRRGCVIRAGYKTGGITQPSGPTFGRFWVPQGTQGYPGPMTFPSGPVSECTNQSEKPSLMKAPSAKKVHFCHTQYRRPQSLGKKPVVLRVLHPVKRPDTWWHPRT